MSKGLNALKELEQELTGFDGYIILHDKLLIATIRNELTQYKEIEEELGIDLVTLFKLVKSKKIYSFGHSNIMENSISDINIYDNTITIWNGYCHSNYALSEYGKSFALTKEELENGRIQTKRHSSL